MLMIAAVIRAYEAIIQFPIIELSIVVRVWKVDHKLHPANIKQMEYQTAATLLSRIQYGCMHQNVQIVKNYNCNNRISAIS